MRQFSQIKPDETVVSMKGVTRVFGKGEASVHALKGVNLAVNKGDFVAVMGASGSGKSTCMNIVGCLDQPSGGSYRFHGAEVSTLNSTQRAMIRRHYIGFVFQGFNLIPRTSALENVELPLIYQRLPKKERQARARHSLDLVGLADRGSHLPNELSGGQQQRVAIARALVTRPRLLLADEPTGNLDSSTSMEIMALLTHLNREQGITIVLVTHEEDMAEYAKRIVVFKDGLILRTTATSGTER